MSGDVQPRKRKDKRRKKDTSSSERSKAEAEYIARKLSVADDSDEGVAPGKPSSSHAPHQLSEGDSIIHVHHEGGTGGHWCAKIIFFILLGILVFLVGLIIIENRGLTDMDTPVAESRYAQVFDGWVDEGPMHDDHHDEHTLELKHGDDSHEDDIDEEHDGEIEDIEDEHGDSEDEHGDSEDEHSDDEEDLAGTDLDEVLSDEDEDDNVDEVETHNVSKENANDDSIENDEQDNEIDDGDEEEDEDDDDEYLNGSQENDDKEHAADDDYDDNDDEEDGENDSNVMDSSENIVELPFEEVDSKEEDVIDNYAGEEEHLAAKQAEQLAQDQEESGIGMRVGIGVALVVVAYCVLARKWQNVSDSAEDTPEAALNRRMTLLTDEEIIDEAEKEIEEKIIEVKKNISTVQSKNPQLSFFSGPSKQIIHRYEEDEDDDTIVGETIRGKETTLPQKTSVEEPEDEEEEEEEEEDEQVEERIQKEIKNTNVYTKDDAEDVDHNIEDYEDEEVLEEELLDEEEEVVEEEEEEDISEELDDSDLMKKLEEKYGKLPQLEDDQPEGHSDDDIPITPARTRGKPSGGNAAGEPEPEEWAEDVDVHWKQQLDLAQAEMDEGRVEEAYRLFTALSLTDKSCPLARLGRARATDILAEKKRSNSLLQATIDEYLQLLDMDIDGNMFQTVAERIINRVRFKGKHLDAVPVHEMLISKFPDQPEHRNHLAITYLMVNKVDLARKVLQDTLSLWPNDGVALVHYGFILKTVDNNLTEAVIYMQKGIDSGANGTLEGRFLFHLGDAFARLGQKEKADEIYKRGAQIGVFLSPQQRSLYNVNRLTGRPWWKPEETPYEKLMKELEENWKQIAMEAKNIHPHFKPEQENLKDTGVWSQYELFMRGNEVKSHCLKCPVTCSIVRKERAAWGCRRGQIKFSAMNPGTHVFAHTGPTNCRIRAHLGLTGTTGTFIRVANETRSWEEGKIFIFDDSFDHEVWHNGTELRIVLIVDLWHPELTKNEHSSLPSI